MSRDSLHLPTARSWRDIPQPVVPRAMSREGRWRLAMAGVRVAVVVFACAALAWGVRVVVVSLHGNSRVAASAVKATPMKRPELRTDGVLDDAWLARTLALPRDAALIQLDLQKLRARLLADDQVVSAMLTKNLPDRLVVQITERVPVARVMTQWRGQQQPMLVARDGVVFAGSGYDSTLLNSLPWLDGVAISQDAQTGHLRPIEGMEEPAELLGKARLEAEHLYSNWQVVSLSRLVLDHRIEVRTKDGSRIVFSTEDDFFRQLAKLNYICDELAKIPGARATIDLSLVRGPGQPQDVPVMVEGAEPATPQPQPRARPGLRAPVDTESPMYAAKAGVTSQPALFVFPRPQPSKTKREL